MNQPVSPSAPIRSAFGFSLVEVTLSLSIIGFAILPMIALLALGTGAVRDADAETRAAQIADSIFADLQRSSRKGGVSLQIEGKVNAATARQLSRATSKNLPGRSIVLIYDDEGRVVEDLGAGSYNKGFPAAPVGVSKLVRIQFGTPPAANFYGEDSGRIYEPDQLISVEVSVEEPVVAKAEERKARRFSSFLNLTNER